jgi:hypothetical protein
MLVGLVGLAMGAVIVGCGGPATNGDAGQTEQLNAVIAAQARRHDARMASGFAAFEPAATRARPPADPAARRRL